MADRPAPQRTLPGWPRGMPLWMAAAYIGVSPGTVQNLEARQELAATWLTDGRKVYLRETLDDFLDRKAGRSNHPADRAAALDPVAEWDQACGDTGGPALP